MAHRRIALTVTLAALLGACVMPVQQAGGPRQYDIREDSTAIVNLSVVTPDNLSVSNTPSMSDEKNLVYTARQWVDGVLPNAASIWRSPVAGGAATKLVAAGDGEWLAMARSTVRGANVYYSLNGSVFSTAKSGAGGRRKYPGTGYVDYSPVPFPDEKRLLFASCSLGKDCYFQDTNYIWLMNPDGTNMTQLRQGRDAQLSPDGKAVAFSYKGDVWTMQIDGTEATNLTASDDYVDTQPTFSPDGQRIYFSRVNAKAQVKQTDIWMMRTDGTEVIQLTMNPAEDYAAYAGPDGFLYFISNRGPLIGTRLPARVWRAEVVQPGAAPPAPAPAAAPAPAPAK